MTDIYKQLARVLDKLPEGFPGTASGVELKILAKLFSPVEAEVACQLNIEPQSPKTVAQRLGWQERETFIALKGMTKKGLIEAEKGERGLSFKLIPFVVGFYENQNARIDKEFAHLVEAYFKEGFYKTMADKPAVHRVIPIETVIPVNIEVMPYQRASTYIEGAGSWGVLPCICRVQKRLIGQGCAHTEENCLVFSNRSRAFTGKNGIRAITKEEAIEILSNAAKEGLVHSTRNVQNEVTYICNCCSCSCGILGGLVQYGLLNAVGRSDFFAAVDESLCSGCTACFDRCQFKALELRGGVCKVNRARCYGCGLCVSECPTGALCLKPKPAAETESPPISESQWQEERTRARLN